MLLPPLGAIPLGEHHVFNFSFFFLYLLANISISCFDIFDIFYLYIFHIFIYFYIRYIHIQTLLYSLPDITQKECFFLLKFPLFTNFMLTSLVIYRDNLLSLALSPKLPGPPLCSGSSCLGLVSYDLGHFPRFPPLPPPQRGS